MNAVAPKPRWLDKRINFSDCLKLDSLLRTFRLNTVCQQASCPNIGECFAKGEATFLILGKNCTRKCKFCRVEKNLLPQKVDPQEPRRIAEAAKMLNLRHVVITSVTRDDLPDGGAAHFSDTITWLRRNCQDMTVEALIPDFKLNRHAVEIVVIAKPEIIAHNLETVPRLYPSVREGANYRRSLEVLRLIKELDKNILTKSGLILGLGEKEGELSEVFQDLRKVGCDFLSIGQYLAPSLKHYPVKEYITPEKFVYYKEKAQALGFLHVVSGPYVRSSYSAKEYLEKYL